MTDQERPVEERNELPGDLPAAAPGVAVVEAEVPPQQQAIESPSPPTAETTDDVGARAADGGDAPSPQTAGDAGVRAVDEGVASSDGSGGEEAARADASPVTDDAGSASVATSPAEEASYQAPAEEAPGRPRRVKDLAPGMELEGRVTSIALYGIFVDIGVGRDGLVHISEMSDTRIESPSDLVKIGDTVKVRVKSVEPDGRRISLTMRTKERSAEPRSLPRCALVTMLKGR
jgi:small subunit ribosomal protein S1